MTPEEHLNKIQQTLDYVATLQRSHDEQIGKLVEQSAILIEQSALLVQQSSYSQKRLDLLAESTTRAMAAIDRLAGIVGIHEQRIVILENR